MKKTFAVIVLGISLASSLFCQKKDYANGKYFEFAHIWHSTDYVTPDGIYEFNNEDDTYKKLDRKLLRLDKDGYVYFDDQIIIPGINWVKFKMPYFGVYDGKSSKNSYYHENFGTKYSASSTLTENKKTGTVTYEAANLGKFAKESFSHYENLIWIDGSLPWVEGEKGYGKGVTIKLSTEEEFDYLMILNGYVDVTRLDLYKKNSRVKTFKVKDLDNNKEYKFELEDIVEFQFFYFSEKTKNVELVIEDVYKGDSWDDTCVKAIIPGSYYDSSNLSSPVQKYSLFKKGEIIKAEVNKKLDFIK